MAQIRADYGVWRRYQSRSSVRLPDPALASRLATCVSTVRTERNSWSATSALLRPAAHRRQHVEFPAGDPQGAEPRAARSNRRGPAESGAPARRKSSRQMRASLSSPAASNTVRSARSCGTGSPQPSANRALQREQTQESLPPRAPDPATPPPRVRLLGPGRSPPPTGGHRLGVVQAPAVGPTHGHRRPPQLRAGSPSPVIRHGAQQHPETEDVQRRNRGMLEQRLDTLVKPAPPRTSDHDRPPPGSPAACPRAGRKLRHQLGLGELLQVGDGLPLPSHRPGRRPEQFAGDHERRNVQQPRLAR